MKNLHTLFLFSINPERIEHLRNHKHLKNFYLVFFVNEQDTPLNCSILPNLYEKGLFRLDKQLCALILIEKIRDNRCCLKYTNNKMVCSYSYFLKAVNQDTLMWTLYRKVYFFQFTGLNVTEDIFVLKGFATFHINVLWSMVCMVIYFFYV